MHTDVSAPRVRIVVCVYGCVAHLLHLLTARIAVPLFVLTAAGVRIRGPALRARFT